jgi:1,4-alpha-glucan branching enzyme
MKRGADGIWSVALELTPGSYQYKFVIDGEWCCSPELLPHPPAQAVECVPNDFGTLNFTTEVAVGPA